jgi:predicted nucleic acid-binding protein
MLIDSNILIYAVQSAHAHLRRFIADHAPAVSAVSYVEVLGYHQLDDQEQQYLEEFFRLARVLPLSQAVLDQAVALRKKRRMSLGDALVAGTALVHGLTLVTRNGDDFQWILKGLSLLNPFDVEPPQEQDQQC